MALIKSQDEIEKISKAGAVLGRVLKKLAEVAKPGVIVNSLDELARNLIEDAGMQPSFLGYRPEGADRPYPATLCASINNVIVHGVPTRAKLKSGDIFSLDLGVKYQGYHSDAAITIGVGDVKPESKKLIEVTRKALELGIAAAQPGNHLQDIGFAISSYVRKNGFHICQGLTGHGIGEKLHEDPSVFNEGQKGKGMEIRPGMVIAIEPMVAIGTGAIIQLPDESYATADGSLAAHFEHTIVITKDGPVILTA